MVHFLRAGCAHDLISRVVTVPGPARLKTLYAASLLNILATMEALCLVDVNALTALFIVGLVCVATAVVFKRESR